MLRPSRRPAELPGCHTPPPLPEWVEQRRERRLALGFAVLGVGVFLMASALNPYDSFGSPLTHGTHRQLGLPPCLMKEAIGLACPSCGMTTSVSLVVHGDPTAAWRANWAGVIVAITGLLATCWMLAVATGILKSRIAVDDVVKWLTVAGTTTTLARWFALIPDWLGL